MKNEKQLKTSALSAKSWKIGWSIDWLITDGYCRWGNRHFCPATTGDVCDKLQKYMRSRTNYRSIFFIAKIANLETITNFFKIMKISFFRQT